MKFLVSRDEVDKLQEQFKYLDRDCDGVISLSEFTSAALEFELNVLALVLDEKTLLEQSSITEEQLMEINEDLKDIRLGNLDSIWPANMNKDLIK